MIIIIIKKIQHSSNECTEVASVKRLELYSIFFFSAAEASATRQSPGLLVPRTSCLVFVTMLSSAFRICALFLHPRIRILINKMCIIICLIAALCFVSVDIGFIGLAHLSLLIIHADDVDGDLFVLYLLVRSFKVL